VCARAQIQNIFEVMILSTFDIKGIKKHKNKIGNKRKRKKKKTLVIDGSKKKKKRVITATTVSFGREINPFNFLCHNILLNSLLESARSVKIDVPNSQDEEEFDNLEEKEACKICFIRKKNVVIKDCGHLEFCITCIRRHLLDNFGNCKIRAKCPVCNTLIKNGAIKAFF
jgi:hypothetical protein